jgi:hypothetical protein
MGNSHRRRGLVGLAAAVVAAIVIVGPSAQANTLGRGLGPSPNPVTYQPLKHTCNSRLPEPLCQRCI